VFDTGWPPLGDGLGAGIEPERIGTVLIEIPEARGFPAAEGVIGDRKPGWARLIPTMHHLNPQRRIPEQRHRRE
ncbi:hypothetical protein FHX35_002453, partial [Auritidibacter ignavus]|nr:hypothetical protein [Auritidibacter ignavus]